MTRKRHTVEIQEDVHDEASIAESWRTRKKLFANVFDVRGGERFRGVQLEANVAVVVDVNYHDWITPMMRLTHGGRTFNVEAVLDRENRRRDLELHCSRVADAG